MSQEVDTQAIASSITISQRYLDSISELNNSTTTQNADMLGFRASLLATIPCLTAATNEMGCSRTISYSFGPQHFSLWFTDDTVAQQGKKKQLTFGIATYTDVFYSNEVALVARGDTITMSPNGLFEVNVSTIESGKQIGEITFLLKNSLSVEIHSWDSEFAYYVAPK